MLLSCRSHGMRSSKFLRLISNKITFRFHTYFLHFYFLFFLEENGSSNNVQNCLIHNILEPIMRVTFFNSSSKSDHTELFPSIVLVIASEKRFLPPKFNLKIMRIQRGGGSWMLLDALLHC